MGNSLENFGDQKLPDESWEMDPTPRVLSNRDRDIFLAMLDADEEPNEAMKAAAERYKEGYYVGDVYHFKA